MLAFGAMSALGHSRPGRTSSKSGMSASLIGRSGSSTFRLSAVGEGELAVRAAFADALFIRPAVMFGPDDAFLTTILKLLDQLPIYPMFGRGPDAIEASLCGGCGGGDRNGTAANGYGPDHVRMRRPSRLYIRGTPQSRSHTKPTFSSC
jgi:hypothetical protein